MELVKSAAGVSIQHVPYNWAAPGVNDLLGGTIPVFIASVPPVELTSYPGKFVRWPRRIRFDWLNLVIKVKTVSEVLPGFDIEAWVALEETTKKLTNALSSALGDMEVAAQLERMGMIAAWMSPEDLKATMAVEEARWSDAIKGADIKPSDAQ